MEDWEEPTALGRLEPCAVWHPDNQVVNWADGLQSNVGLSKNHCSSNLELQKPSQKDCACAVGHLKTVRQTWQKALALGTFGSWLLMHFFVLNLCKLW